MPNITTTSLQRAPVAGLDILRFSAACLVMFYHLGVASWAAPESITTKLSGARSDFSVFLPFAWFGFVGVEIFFVISGFVICYSAESSSFLQFVQRRAVRLYPAALICAIITATVRLTHGSYDSGNVSLDFVRSISLWPTGPWIDSVYWTLGIEIAFYSTIATLILFNMFSRLRQYAYALGGASAAYWIFGSLLFNEKIHSHLWDRRLELSMITYGVYFAIGAILYKAHSERRYRNEDIAFLSLCIVGAVIETYYKSIYNIHLFRIEASAWIPSFTFLSGIACFFTSLSWEPTNRLTRLLRVAGIATYPLYLLHNNVGAFFLGLMTALNPAIALACSMAICITLSLCVSLYFEPIIRRWFSLHSGAFTAFIARQRLETR